MRSAGRSGPQARTPRIPIRSLNPTDVAIDQASHDIYVADPGNYRVEKFDSSGHFLLMFGEEVDKTTGGNVCTAESGNTCQPGTASSAAGGFEDPTSLAVDNYPGGQGDVYVGDTGDGLVQKFTSAGSLITTWGSNGQKDGSDATDLPVFGPVYGVAVGGGCATPTSPNNGCARPTEPSSWTVATTLTYGSTRRKEPTSSGTTSGSDSPLKVDSEGNIYAQGWARVQKRSRTR